MLADAGFCFGFSLGLTNRHKLKESLGQHKHIMNDKSLPSDIPSPLITPSLTWNTNHPLLATANSIWLAFQAMGLIDFKIQHCVTR